MTTENQNPASMNLDQMSMLEMLTVMNDEDQKVALAVRESLPQIAEAVTAIAVRMQRGGRLIYVGAGTSGRLGVLDAVECVPTFSTDPKQVIGLIAGGQRAVTSSVEGAEDDPITGMDNLTLLDLSGIDVVVGIAASGTTPYVLGAMDYANKIGALTVGVACNVPSPLLERAQIPIGVPVGPEVLTGSTRLKAGTAQKLVLNMLSTATMVQLGKVYGNLMVDVQITNEKLAARACRIVSQVTGMDEERATALLKLAGGNAKTAIVMAIRDVSADDAKLLLEAHGGRLREIIG